MAARADLKVSQGDIDKGLAEFKRAVVLDKQEPSVYVCRGLAHCRIGDFIAAEADFTNALKLDAQCHHANRLLALLYAATTETLAAQRALLHARQAVEQARSLDWASLEALAAAQAAAGQFDEAAATIQRAAGLALAEKRDLCLQRKVLYEQKQPLRMNWLSSRAE